MAETPGVRVRLPDPEHRDPIRQAGARLLLGVGLILFVMILVLLQRGGYQDAAGGSISAIDALYYATVSVTTVGYGDITPVTQSARLLNALLITPARVIFLILLVGSVFELATGSLRTRIREGRWRSGLKNHFIVVGFGVKGKSAVRVLLGRGVPRDRILIIDRNRQSVEEAAAAGLVAIPGDAARTSVLEEAGIGSAQALVVAPDTDEAAVLVTLTARQMVSRRMTIVAAAREEENAQLLRQSGADSVITSAEAAGRLLGLATETPRLVKVLEDLLATGVGLDIAERPIEDGEAGPRANLNPDHLIVGVVRDTEVLRFDDPRTRELLPGDRILYLYNADEPEKELEPDS